jgi:hypothetical protein
MMTNKYIHFGDLRYEDYTKHQDLKRLNNYLSRATKIKGNWKKDKYSPNNLAINLIMETKVTFRTKLFPSFSFSFTLKKKTHPYSFRNERHIMFHSAPG